jgi:transposase InsO family protein
LRDEVVHLITDWHVKTEIPLRQFLTWLNVFPSRFYEWKRRTGVANHHNTRVPKKHWLLPWERDAIVSYAKSHPNEGYRRLTYMMLDADVVAASASSVYRVLKSADLLMDYERKDSRKGEGFEQPTHAHEHWHIDISYINIACTFYYFCCILDGFSRYIVHWDLRPQMQESDVEIILQRALEKFPGQKPRIISDNGPQFIANDFKEFIRSQELTHIRTSPYYPQGNGKLERLNRSYKSECVRSTPPTDVSNGISQTHVYVDYYNTQRLHSAIGYITPHDKLLGHAPLIFARRKNKLMKARSLRQLINKGGEEIKK